MELLSKHQRKKLIRIEWRKMKKTHRIKPETQLVTDYYHPTPFSLPHVDGCCIVLVRKKQNHIEILFRRCYCNSHEYFFLMKGHRKVGESNLEASVRELKRYTDLDSSQYCLLLNEEQEPNSIILEYEPFYRNKFRIGFVHKNLHIYFAKLTDYQVQFPPNQYGSYHWIDLNQATTNPTQFPDFHSKIKSELEHLY